MPAAQPFPPPYRQRRPRRARRHAPGPRLSRRLERAIEELEPLLLLLYAPDERSELLERADGPRIASALHLARRAAAREARTDWLPGWPDGAQITNHDAYPLLSRALKALRLIEARWEVREG